MVPFGLLMKSKSLPPSPPSGEEAAPLPLPPKGEEAAPLPPAKQPLSPKGKGEGEEAAFWGWGRGVEEGWEEAAHYIIEFIV